MRETNLPPQSSGMLAATVFSLMKEITSSLSPPVVGFQDLKLNVTTFDLREAKNERSEV